MSGGASKGALRLHKGLLDIGVESHLCGNNNTLENIENLIELSFLDKVKYSINRKKNTLDLSRYNDKSDEIFSVGKDPFNCFKHINFSDYDIVNLHWVNYSINIDFIGYLKTQTKLVWTLRDMWPFTGGCHYSLDCIGYKKVCGYCPKLKSNSETDISNSLLLKKQLAFKNIQFIAISDWLKTEALSSTILNNSSIDTIYNSVDVSEFTVINDIAAIESLKKKFNIKTTKKIILTGAQDVMDTYKGPGFVREFIKLHSDEFYFIIFGQNAETLTSGLDVENIQLVGFQDEPSLAKLYNIADYFLMCSIQEGFGKTIVESLSCGTPVITLAGGAPEELILATEGGFIWDGVSKLDLSAQKSPEKLSLNAKNKFSLETIAKLYESKYVEITSG
ncbi:MAG: glycosyltransferase [Aliiglaciecola sp.]|uniref:glycosyltransferase n=1 Tax=Aliiglaciecola sp. TaxID=1872441 RepID=UPI00329836D6